jgi:hypothetical protein
LVKKKFGLPTGIIVAALAVDATPNTAAPTAIPSMCFVLTMTHTPFTGKQIDIVSP